MIAAKRLSHVTRPFPTHRVSSTGHKAATPGRMISLNPTPEALETGSTWLIPTVRNAIANNRPIPVYTPSRLINHSATTITVASFLSLAAVDRYHGSTDLRRVIGDQMNQEIRYLARVNPFRVIGTRIGNTIGGRIHGAGEQYVRGHVQVRIFARDSPHQRYERGLRRGIDARQRCRFHCGLTPDRYDPAGSLHAHDRKNGPNHMKRRPEVE